MIITHRKQLLPKHYGFGIRYHRDIRGEGVFDSIKKYGKPALSFLYNKILKPFWKNNKDDIISGVTSGFKNIVSTHQKSPPFAVYKDEIIKPILKKMKEKPLNEHLRGDGMKLTKQSKQKLKTLIG